MSETREHALTFADAPEGFVHCWRCQRYIDVGEWAKNLPCPGPPNLPIIPWQALTCSLCGGMLGAKCSRCREVRACVKCDVCRGCDEVVCASCLPEHRHAKAAV